MVVMGKFLGKATLEAVNLLIFDVKDVDDETKNERSDDSTKLL